MSATIALLETRTEPTAIVVARVGWFVVARLRARSKPATSP